MLIHLFPGPTETRSFDSERVRVVRFWREMRIPPEMLELPGKGVWPPERTANGTEKKLMILIDFATSCAEVGTKMTCGGNHALIDLFRFRRISTMLTHSLNQKIGAGRGRTHQLILILTLYPAIFGNNVLSGNSRVRINTAMPCQTP